MNKIIEENKVNKGMEPSTAATRRTGVPLAAIIPLVLIASGVAYFVGRGSTGIASPNTVSQEAKSSEEVPADKEGSGLITLSPAATRTAGIKTATAKTVRLTRTLTVPGTVEVSADRGATVTPPVAGRIVALAAKPGDHIAAGQLLARLDSPDVAATHAAVHEAEARVADARAAVQSAEAGFEQARTKAGSAQSALARQKELAASGQIAQPSLQAAQNTLADTQAAQKEADAALALARSAASRAQRLFDAQVAAWSEWEQAQTAFEQAEAQAERAKQQVGVAQAALMREQRVYSSGLLNRQAIQGAQAEVAAAQGDVRQAQKQVQAARTTLAGAIGTKNAALANLRSIEGSGHIEGDAGLIALYSPMEGTIRERKATTGQAVERSSEMFVVQNLSLVTVVANVPEADVANIHPGAPVSVKVAAYPGKTFTGTVQSVEGAVDKKTRALPVRCIVRNPGGLLKPEMFARISLGTGSTRTAVAVPDAAVDEDGDKRFVYVAVNGGYEKRAVSVGDTRNGRTEIVAGIQSGENIVTNGIFVLKSESKKDELKDED